MTLSQSIRSRAGTPSLCLWPVGGAGGPGSPGSIRPKWEPGDASVVASWQVEEMQQMTGPAPAAPGGSGGSSQVEFIFFNSACSFVIVSYSFIVDFIPSLITLAI